MAFKLVWSEAALEDIDSIAQYIEKDSTVYAQAVVTKLFEKAELLVDFPELSRTVPEIGDTDIRELFVYSYRLIYKRLTDTILIVAIVHGKRLLEHRR